MPVTDPTSDTPWLAVLLATDRWETLEPVLASLRRSARSEGIEVLVLPHGPALPDPPCAASEGLHALHAVGRASGRGVRPSRADALALARAPLVLVGETHAFPAPGWSDAVLEAHRTADVVVPAFENANPGTALSWGAFLQDYGSCGPGRPPGEPSDWPGFNVTYRRELLVALGDDLDDALEAGDAFRDALRSRGARVEFVPEARVRHVNVDRPPDWLRERFLRGRLIARSRRRGWSWGRRLAYALAAPAVAVALLRRNADALRWARRSARLPPGSTTAWVAGMLVRVAGETVGYLTGASDASRRAMDEYEIRKLAYVRPEGRPGEEGSRRGGALSRRS